MRLVTTLPLIAAAALSACAPVKGGSTAGAHQQTDARTCFRTMNVRNFRAPDFQTLYVRSSAKDVFQIQTYGACRDVDTAVAIELRPLDGFSTLCTGDFATLNVVTPSHSTCRVLVTKRMTVEEVAALPGRDRP